MNVYRDLNGDSGVSRYEYGSDWIRVEFKRGGTYEYHASAIGAFHLNTMKRLADTGDGLNAYINTNPEVKRNYSSKS